MKGQTLQIKPSRSQAQALARWIGCQRFIYNAKVQDDRYFRRFARKSLQLVGQHAPIDQTYSQYKSEAHFLSEVPSQVLRNGAVRWYGTYQRFFKKLGGRPKLKKRHGRQSVMLTSELFAFTKNKHNNWFIDLGTKKFPLGSIRVNTQTDLETLPKMVVVSVHAGRWSLSFATPNLNPETGEHIQYPEYTDVLAELAKYTEEELALAVNGVDRGVVKPACDSKRLIPDDLLSANERRLARKEKQIKQYQRQKARQKPGSRRYRRTCATIAQLKRYRANCIANMAHQVSHRLAADETTKVVAMEGLNVANMTASAKGTKEKPGKRVKQKGGLNRSIAQSGWGRMRQYVRYKLHRRGKLLIMVPPHYTSQECSHCGAINKASRASQSGFACTACGFSMNADQNAARVIARHAVHGLMQHRQPGQELSTGDREKPRPQTPVELLVRREVITSFRAQCVEAGNRHLNVLKAG